MTKYKKGTQFRLVGKRMLREDLHRLRVENMQGPLGGKKPYQMASWCGLQ